jgi:hypothetical protein
VFGLDGHLGFYGFWNGNIVAASLSHVPLGYFLYACSLSNTIAVPRVVPSTGNAARTSSLGTPPAERLNATKHKSAVIVRIGRLKEFDLNPGGFETDWFEIEGLKLFISVIA